MMLLCCVVLQHCFSILSVCVHGKHGNCKAAVFPVPTLLPSCGIQRHLFDFNFV
jgi:hypothetical protein